MRDFNCYDAYCEIDKSFIVANIGGIDTFEYVTRPVVRGFRSFISHLRRSEPTTLVI